MAQDHLKNQNQAFERNEQYYKSRLEQKFKNQDSIMKASMSPNNKFINYSMLMKNRDKEVEERSNLQKIQADKMAEIHEKN